MPVNSEHPDYEIMYPAWEKSRDAYAGEDRVKLKGEHYLPKLTGQDTKEYDAYKERAMFYGATARTVDGLAGMVMRKNPVVKLPAAIEHLEWDATGTGIDLVSLTNILISEMVLTGRIGLNVDKPLGDGKSYLTYSIAEDIVNWSCNEDGELNLVVIKELYTDVTGTDRWEREEKIRYREYWMRDEDPETGEPLVNPYLEVNLYEDDAQQKNTVVYKLVETIVPTFRGTPLDHIPFSFANIFGTSKEIVIPPLLQMINVNYSHYRSSADLEHGRHFTGLPTPYLTGVNDEDFEDGVKIGSENCLLLPEGASAGYMEFTGGGLKYLEQALKDKEMLMSVLGARMLEAQKKTAEAAETARINKSGDNSIMTLIATSVETIITNMLEEALAWEGGTGSVEFEINKDFLDVDIPPTTITALMNAWQNGAISHETFLYNMKKGEVLADDVSVEEEMNRIELERPAVDFDEEDDVGDLENEDQQDDEEEEMDDQ